MKHSTEYLFDKPRSAYEPEVTVLATARIADGKALMKRLARAKDRASLGEIPKLIERYQAAEEAVKHWTKILNEE